jgi:hypothetical protein
LGHACTIKSRWLVSIQRPLGSKPSALPTELHLEKAKPPEILLGSPGVSHKANAEILVGRFLWLRLADGDDVFVHVGPKIKAFELLCQGLDGEI